MTYSRHRTELAFIEGGEDFEARPSVEVLKSGTGIFGGHGSAFLADQYRSSDAPEQSCERGRGRLERSVQNAETISPVARRSARPAPPRWRVGWTRIGESDHAIPRSKSIHRPVPVNPVCPMVAFEHESPPCHPGWQHSQPTLRVADSR